MTGDAGAGRAAPALEVSGGVGGTSADVAEMLLRAATLVQAGSALADVAGQVVRVGADPSLAAGALLDPAGLVAAEVAVATAAAQVMVVASEVTALGHALAAAAGAYAVAEEGVRAAVAGARDHAARLAGGALLRVSPRVGPYAAAALVLPVGAWLTVRWYPAAHRELLHLLDDARRGRLRLDSLDDRVVRMERRHGAAVLADLRALGEGALAFGAEHPDLTQHVVGALPAFLDGVTGPVRTGPVAVAADGSTGTWPPRDVRELALLLSAVGTLTPAMPPEGGVRVDVASSGPSTHASGVRQLLGRAVPYSPPVGPGADATTWTPSRLRVDRLERPGGTAWVVTLPPTQQWAPVAGANPFDAASNVRTMGGQAGASSQAAVEAMRAAGVRPGEPVMLVGYSQGGLTALQVASDPAVRAQVDVTTVLTAGAPVGGYSAPEGVDVLALEHEQDLVVTLDGRPNPDDPQWTTVRRDLVTGSAADVQVRAAGSDRPWAAHELRPYLATAALVDSSTDESVRAWLREAAPFLAVPGTSATSTEYDVERSG